MVKLSNISNSIMTNPLVGVVIAIFLLLIALAVIRMFQPDFSMGAKLEGHFGSLDGKINLEAFEADYTQDDMNEGNNMESFQNMEEEMPSMPDDMANMPNMGNM